MTHKKPDTKQVGDGRRRIVLENLTPAVDGGRYPVKRVAGDRVTVEVDAFTDGHDRLSCMLRYRRANRHSRERGWQETPMEPLVNDRWRGTFEVGEPGDYLYTVYAWVDHFKTWRHDLARRDDPVDVELALREGAAMLQSAARAARGEDARWLRDRARALTGDQELATRAQLALAEDLSDPMLRYASRALAQSYHSELRVSVDDERARYSSWYELFPRSCSPEPGRHGTLRDVESRLDYVAAMGFNVLYLPPIHPIGERFRKGANNALRAAPGEPGVPWAIGSRHGGHKAVHPDLGTLDDFRRLVAAAGERGIEVALDIAFQCSPDHPYLEQHPQWFRWRPDGTVQYAENPPKKYQDIYPFDFETKDWKNLWAELKSIFDFWLGNGVRIFRVDNPHTKPFALWQWIIGEIRREHPTAIFLAEAFTRPKVMHRLAKIGFNQSYTYFTWRNGKEELAEYLLEVANGPGADYFRPNFWPNTPDILHETLQHGGPPAFRLRLLLAATMTANYGIYGPAFELQEATPREPGSEEYLDSEKYQLRNWDLDAGHSLRPLLTRINEIRDGNRALQANANVAVHGVDNGQLLCYSKASDDFGNVILVVVNLDPRWTQSGWTDLDLAALGVDDEVDAAFVVHDLLTDAVYRWQGRHNYVELNPAHQPGHVFLVSREGETL